MEEVIKYLLLGADAVMTTFALLRYGIGHIGNLLHGPEDWLGARGFDSLASVPGRMSHLNAADPVAFERAGYIKTLRSYALRALVP